MRADQIALELYTVRELAKQDFPGTLRKVAEVGYGAVELAGYHGVPVAELRAVMDEVGLRAMAAHVPIGDFENRLGDALAELKTLGCEFAIVPWLAPERRGADEVPRLAEAFNRWGAACRDEGLRFGYHNHDFEFAPMNGGTQLDALLAATDPELVALELDVGWSEFSGVDSVALLRRLGPRVPLLHVKDLAEGGEGRDVAVGDGTIAWEPILAAATAAEWYVVEQDNPGDAMEDIRRSLRHLQGLATQTAA